MSTKIETVATADCACCDGDARDIDGSMVQAYVIGYLAAASGHPVQLCMRHQLLAHHALRFIKAHIEVPARSRS